MPLKHIAELTPELPARATIQFRAAVTLIWPYSSSQREFALLLAEPEFRLRRRKGQVRARFHGSSARALATTGVGIGDEVVLGLQGAQFVQENTISTPGKSIDWELQYTQTVVVQVFRNGSQIANLEVVDAAPTPAPRSPVRAQSTLTQSPAQQWSSPAFLKRVRLSDGPSFEAPYDPLADDIEDGHARKRRRKSYRDWKAWTYSARTPSPSKEDAGDDDEDIYAMEASPSRPAQFPDTPVSPARADESHGRVGVIDLAVVDNGNANDGLEDHELLSSQADKEEKQVRQSITAPKMSRGDPIQSDPNHDLYAGPDEIPPSEAPYAFGGDTEANTEEDDDLEDTDGVTMSSTEANTEVPDNDYSHTPPPVDANDQEPQPIHDGSLTEEDSVIEIVEPQDTPEASNQKSHDQTGPEISIQPSHQANPPLVFMPPPTLSALNTSFGGQFTPGLLTPTGREPASPTLQPLDSATLPLPSPFPGERDGATSSYLDHVPDNEQAVQADPKTREELDLPSDADYIVETSFFSSIGSSKIPATHPDHETAFTPVRFTFGLDGSGYSRPLQTSSPVPDEKEEHVEEEAQPSERSQAGAIPFQITKGNARIAENDPETESPSDSPAQEAKFGPKAGVRPSESPPTDVKVSGRPDENRGATSPEVIELLSGSESEDLANRDEIVQQQSPSVREERANDVILAGGTETHQPDLTQSKPKQLSISSLDALPGLEQDGTTVTGEGDLESVPQQISACSTNPPEIDPFAEFMELSSPPQSRGSIEPGYAAALARDGKTDDKEPQKFTDTQHNDRAAVTDQLFSIEEPTEQNQDCAVPSSKISEPTAITHPQQSHDENALGITDADTVMADISGVMQPSTVNTKHEDDLHPDIKVESVEEDIPSLSQIHPTGPHEDTDDEVAPGSPDTMLIDVPNIEHEIGELHTVAVPATSPAMNTRSRTKTPVSPTIAHSELSKRTPQSTRSRASGTRTTTSPPVMRRRSTVSPIQEVKRSSPYSLRSQSKLPSPMESTFDASTTSPRRTRGHTSKKSIGSITDMSDTQSSGRVPSRSPALEASQVKSSEHTTDSIELKPPPSVRRPRTRAGSKVQSITEGKESLQEQRTSPEKSHRRLRSTGSVVSFEEPPSSPSVRTTRRHVYNLASTPPRPGEDSETQTTPRAQKAGEVLLKANQGTEGQEAPAQQRSLRIRNRPLTPDATQETTSDSQNDIAASQQQHTLPLTPNLTQRTSSLRSFHKTVESQAEDTGGVSRASPVTKSTPRRKHTETDVVAATTAREQSPAITTEEAETSKPTEAEPTTEDVEAPTIGLSTPLAYYTPLNALSYFLNRSSQFHSNSNPDILALVTSATTTPVRAPKGPKHWYTTLHITDASVWPAHNTTVNVFRAYQSALPHADVGDVILLRAFGVKSLNRQPSLISADESAWCVWRFGRPVTGRKRGAYGELKAREEVKGPEVERGEGEWVEIGKIRGWFEGVVKGQLKEREETKVVTRSRDKGATAAEEEGEEPVKNEGGQRRLRSREVADVQDGAEEVVETRRQTRSQDKKA